MEHKQTETIITATDEDKGIIEAVWAVMGNIDDGNDIIHPGAFTKTFNERGNQIKLLDNHRASSVMDSLGLVKELREIRRGELPQELLDRYPDATGGAWGKFQFLMDTPEGKGAFSRLKNKAVTGWSFGYDAVDKDHSTVDKNGKKIPIRNLRQIKLYEISPVLFAMNEATATTDAKALHDYEEEEQDKAKWSTAFINNLPDSSFLLVESGDKDEEGKTTPRSLRHLPYKDADGNVDLPHLRNAITRLSQTDTGEAGGESWLTEATRKRLLSRARSLLEEANKSDEIEPEEKAGRVLSAQNIKRIMSAMQSLHEALAAAGVTMDDNTGPSKSQTPTSKEAGPDVDNRDTLQLINIELETLEV